MRKRTLAAVLAVLVLQLASGASVFARTNEEKQAARKAEFTSKVKRGVDGLGRGRDARIEVRTRSNTKVVGYVGNATDTAFTVVDPKSGVETTVQYDDVAKVKGNNLATGWKIAIGIGIGVAAVFVTLIAIYAIQESN